MSTLSLSLLGTFGATVGERPLTQFRTNKVQALLIYLVVEPVTVYQREMLMAFLWPGLPLKSAQVNLRQIIYQLNQIIPAYEDGKEPIPFLITTRKTIERHPDYPVSCDVTELTTRLQKSWHHDHPHLHSCPTCHKWLEEAVTYYDGEFLADFSLYDSNPFEAWAQSKREMFHRQTLDALDSLTNIKIAQEAFLEAEALARRQLELDNLREIAYRQLMRILAMTGRRSEAIGLYESCRQLLTEEVGITPSAKTEALKEQIRGGSLTIVSQKVEGIRGYEIGEKLGEGAFGAVYRGVQKGIGREVAIKIIHAAHANRPQFIRRFETEAQIVARLEHPHIVPLYDYWREPDGAFLVMRWLRGGSLRDVLKKEQVSLPTAVSFIAQIASALHVAHRHGIVHRDVKPANILLDDDNNVYLSDFGIARDRQMDARLTAVDEMVGSPNYISPEQLLGEEVTSATDIYCLGLLIFELLTGERPYSDSSMVELLQKQIHEPLPLLIEKRHDLSSDLDIVIQKATAKKATDRYVNTLALAEAFRKVVDGQNGRSPIKSTPTLNEIAEADIVNPYKGLHAFQVQDADNFYGRSELIVHLIDRLTPPAHPSAAEERFLAIVGPSGSGKSSVVKAGLIPRIKAGAIPGSENWFVAEMTPGSYPLEELEAALLRIVVDPPKDLITPLQKDERGLVRLLKRLLPQEAEGEASQLLLVIDQFEELFTLTQNESDRSQFLANLFAAMTEAHSRLWVVITLRADFYDRPLHLPQLAEWMRQRTEVVLPMKTAELEEAIVKPAANMGVAVEPALVAAVLTDVKEQPGALPMMQYALTEIFERRNGRALTLAVYESIGGITGALAQRADEIYQQLNDDQQEATRQLFLRLVTLGERIGEGVLSPDTRRRVRQSELVQLDPQDGHPSSLILHPLELYGRYRLLTFDHDPATREPTVEVAHEALLREWPRLQEWLEESRDEVRRQRLLGQAAGQWQEEGKEDSYLLRGGRLEAFAEWAQTTSIALTQLEQEFLQSSIEAQQQRVAAEEERRQRELETAQRLAKEQSQRAEEQEEAAVSLRRRAFFLAGALLVAAVLAGASVLLARSSNANAQLASARELEALTNAELAATNEANALTNANLAATRESEAEQERETAQTEANIRATAEADALEQQAIAEEQEKIAQEQLLLTTSRELALAANANLESNPERSLLLGLEALDNAYTVEAEEAMRTALQMSRIEFTLTTEADDVTWVDYDPDGLWVAGVSESGGQIIIWDSSTGAKLHTASLDTMGIRELEISPDGTRLGIATQNKIMLLDTSSWEVVQILEGHIGDVRGIAFNPESVLLASGSEDGVMKIWHVASGEEQLSLIASDVGWVANVIFSRDGLRIATVGDDLTARVWDVNTGDELLRMQHDAFFVENVAFNADGTRLFVAPTRNASGSDLVIWNIETESDEVQTEPLYEWFGMHGSSFTEDIALSPDGRFLATASQDSTVKLWDATSETPVEILTLSGHQAILRDIAISPDGDRLVSTSEGEARIWNISEAGYGEFLNIADSSYPIAFTPDNSLLITNSSDHFLSSGGMIKIWNVMNGTLLESFDSRITTVKSATVSDSGRYLAVGGIDNVVKIWDLTTFQEVLTLTEHGPGLIGGIHAGVMALDFSPDETLLATAGADGFVLVWDIATGEKRHEWRVDPRDSAWSEDEPFANGATGIKFSPDGQLLAASTDHVRENEGGTATSLIKIWDVSSGEERLVIGDILWRNWDLAFSPDGQHITSAGSPPPGVAVWDVKTGEQLANLEAAPGTAGFVTYAADGKRLFSGHFEVLVWDIEAGNALFRMPEATRIPVVSSDGRYLAAQGNGRIHIYALDFEELIAIAQSRVTRSLTDAECQQYLHVEKCPEDG